MTACEQRTMEVGINGAAFSSAFRYERDRRRDGGADHWKDFPGLVERMAKHQALEERLAKAYIQLGRLLEQAGKCGLLSKAEARLEILEEILFKTVDRRAANPALGFTDDLNNLAQALSSAGLSDPRSPGQLREWSRSGKATLIEAAVNSLLNEAAQLIANQAAEQKSRLPQQLQQQIGTIRNEFVKGLPVITQTCFEVTALSDGCKVSIKPAANASPVISFKFANTKADDPKLQQLLYDLVKSEGRKIHAADLQGGTWFQQLMANGELLELKHWRPNGEAVIIERAAAGLVIEDVEFNNCTVKLCGPIKLTNVRMNGSQVLFKNCEQSWLDGVKIDKDCSLAGTLAGSEISETCSIAGHAAQLDLRAIKWNVKSQAVVLTARKREFADRMKGLVFSFSRVDDAFMQLIKGKFKILTPAEYRELNHLQNCNYSNRAVEALKKAGLKTEVVQGVPTGSALPAGVPASAVIFMEVTGAFRGGVVRSLILPKVEEKEPGKCGYGPSLIYDESFAAIVLKPGVSPADEVVTVPLAVLRILEECEICQIKSAKPTRPADPCLFFRRPPAKRRTVVAEVLKFFELGDQKAADEEVAEIG